MRTSELYELLRQYEAKTTRMLGDESAMFDLVVALKLGYYVDWNKMVKH